MHKKIFKMAAMAAILDVRSEVILTTFNLQVTQILLTMFQANWPFDSGKKFKLDFKMAAMVVILDFRSERFKLLFDLQVHDTSYQVSSQMTFRLRRDFQDFRWERFCYF